jgi:PAS domain S-box-containing protein
MTATDTALDSLRRELIERIARLEQRAEPLAAPLTETPTPAGLDTSRHIVRFKSTIPRMEAIPSAVIASLDDVIWSLSPDGERVYHMAGGVERTFGRSAEEFLPRPGLWFEIVPEADRATLRAAFAQLLITGSLQVEHAVKTANGSLRWVASRGKLIRADDGTPLRIDGITTDTTHRARTERTGLAILEAIGPRMGPAFLDAAVEQLAKGFETRAAVIAVPDDADIHTARTVAAWIDGRLAEPFAFPASGRFVREVLAGGSQFLATAARDRFPGDEFLKRLRAESAAAAPLIHDSGRLLGFVAVIDDRSLRGSPADMRPVLRALAPRLAVELARRESDEPVEDADQSRETERLAGVGRLLAGVAHDFNNLLTLVTGHAELMRESLDAADPLRESADLIASSGAAAARVARQLLSYARPPAGEDSFLDPNAALRESESLLRRFTGSHIELDLLLAPGVGPLRVDRGDFDRVVLNLVANARDAIAEDGVISIRTAIANIPADRRGWPADRPPGDYFALTVTDTGCGMTDEVKARAFTRFFTTKGKRGTGLGLASVQEMVHAAGGHVELESSTDWGTSVRVFWPLPEDPDEPISLSFPNG